MSSRSQDARARLSCPGMSSRSQDARAADLLDLLLSALREEAGLDDDRLLGQLAGAEDLEVPRLDDVDHGRLVLLVLVVRAVLLRDEGPQRIEIDRRAVRVVLPLVEVAHADLTEVARVVLVEPDAVVVLAAGVATAGLVLAVLADVTVAARHVAAVLAVLLQARRHGRKSSLE